MLCRRSCVTGDCIGACANDPAVAKMMIPVFTPTWTKCQHECREGENWSCIGNLHWPAVGGPTRNLSVKFTDPVSSNPITGISVRMCGPSPECPVPISTSLTDETGTAHLVDDSLAPGAGNVDQGLNGYLQILKPPASDGGGVDIYPTHVYWGFPLSESQGRLGEPLPLLSTAELSLVVSSVTKLAPDPTMGQVAMLALDCLGTQAPGVSFSIRGAGTGALNPVYLDGLTPSPTATKTFEGGTAFFFNVPPGSYDITANPAALDGRASSTVSVYVHAGVLTEVALAPTPDR